MEITQQQLKFLEDSVPGSVGIYQIRDGRIAAIYLSPSLHNVVGYDREEYEKISRRDTADTVIPEDLPTLRETIALCIRTKKPAGCYWRVLHPAQGFIWVHGSATYCGELDGYPVLLVSYGQDTNEMDLYKDVVDNSSTMVYVCDCNTYEILYANEAARRYGGNTGVNPLGRPCYKYMHGREGPCEDCFLKTVERGGLLDRERFNLSRGRWEHLTGKYINWCGHDAFIQYLQDINEAKTAELRIKDSERRYSVAVKGAHLGVWEYNVKEKRITGGNEVFALHGLTETIEDVPRSLYGLFGENNRAALDDMYRRIDEGESEVSQCFWWNGLPQAQPLCEQVYYTVVKDSSGRPDIAYGVSIDITSQETEKQKFDMAMQSLLAINPAALCTFRFDLTDNTAALGHGSASYIISALRASTVDGVLANTAALIPGRQEREKFAAVFNRQALIGVYESGKSSLQYEYRRKGENERLIWVRTYANLLKEPATGHIICVIYSVDITKEVIRDEAFGIITSQAYDLVMLLHPDTGEISVISMGDELSREFGGRYCVGGHFNFESMRETALDKLSDMRDRSKYNELSCASHIRQVMDSEGYYELIIPVHLSTGSETHYRKFQNFYMTKENSAILILGSDSTGLVLQKQKEAELAKTEAERVTDILDSITAGITVQHMTDPDHLSYEYVNRQMYRMLGFPDFDNDIRNDRNITDKTINAYMSDGFSGVHPDYLLDVKKTFHDNYDSPEFTVGPYRTLGAGGRYYWLKQIVRMREITPEYHIFYSIYRDVEKEISLENELHHQLEAEKSLRRQADAANAAKSDFLSRMSHDMRTPLNVILGITHLSLERPHTEQTRADLGKIDTSSRFLLGLINDVLDMTKAESGHMTLKPEPYTEAEFNGYIDDFVRPLCESKGLVLDYSATHAGDCVAVIDKLRANQVLFNLISNASKFTPEGGTITLHLAERLTKTGRLRMTVTVGDTGIGMTREFQKHLFEPFTQEHRNDNSPERGTGLGLAIVKAIVDMMGGGIKVKSSPGNGTVFTLSGEFDWVTQDSVKAVRDTASNDPSVLAGRHILVCEDHPLNQEIAKALLEEKLMIVDIAENGQIGIQKFSRSSPGYYDAVLMDIRMPIMDGYEATAAIRALKRTDAASIPIIAMTADAYADDIQKCLAAGMNGHISKPIDPQALESTLIKCMAPTGS